MEKALNRKVASDIHEEEKNLIEIQDIIQSQMTDRMDELGILKEEIVEGRKRDFKNLKLEEQYAELPADRLREAYYTSTYERILQLSKMYYTPYFGMIDYQDHVSPPSSKIRFV